VRIPLGFVPLAAAGAALLAVPLVAGAQSNRPALSLEASPDTVTFGQSARLSGKVSGRIGKVRTIVLEHDPYPFGDGFSRLGSKRSRRNGSYTFEPKPDKHTHYRVGTVHSDPYERVIHSPARLVRSRMLMTFRVNDRFVSRRQRVRFSGSVLPGHPGRLVYLQKMTRSGRFRTFARTRQRDAGRGRSFYSYRTRLGRSGTFRARSSGDRDHLSGTSGTTSVLVSRRRRR
jgi:hypothetical protein